ncbi:MAG: hypothetical protein A2X13_02340 [Bacteroidetes bacterium GWC2_33_15]|nr:MAG: hypothetical protein A2X10_03330 [Bacteroidetes bacterium GWA2_33_15]OFX49615.1 MAG: hypothetical protein A2X13_02340 [Bacteroidetes bacterium GWC2_33_15]OFX66313.1 MAG: hypothetical protein A2X15_04810 [Bacteroidetes bacterium GWB2_32_14]OFX70102.1 MAG: hypothetical protein A2X14_01380 [Bacteroidetes bacterium GWD2_33_33]HAN17027.1 hypothetical protein [Bacteroidales bacterium]
MKKLTLISLLFLTSITLFSQKTLPMDSVIKRDEGIFYYCIIDSLLIKKYNSYNIEKAIIFINETAVDTVNLSRRRYFPVSIKENIYFNSFMESKELNDKFYYSKSNKEFEFYNCQFFSDYLQTQFFISEGVFLYIINPITCEKLEFANFSKHVEKETINGKTIPLGEIHDVNFINNQKAIIELCLLGENDCEGSKYFIVDSKSIHDKTNNIKPSEFDPKKHQDYYSDIQFMDKTSKKIRESVKISGWHGRDDLLINRLFDENLTLLGKALVLNQPFIAGINIQNDNVVNYFLGSSLNDRTKVVIPYKFNTELEIVMYKVYNDILLKTYELKSLEKLELGILRNLIFAKYNYDFTTEFYQAYFNLFEFYSSIDKRNTRTKNVNDKLTEIDKANIALIKEIEK